MFGDIIFENEVSRQLYQEYCEMQTGHYLTNTYLTTEQAMWIWYTGIYHRYKNDIRRFMIIVKSQ